MFETETETRSIQRWSRWPFSSMELRRAANEPAQFHVSRNGLALLVAYVLHMIDIRHAIIPT
jgi:hypothetical protein